MNVMFVSESLISQLFMQPIFVNQSMLLLTILAASLTSQRVLAPENANDPHGATCTSKLAEHA